MVEITEKKPVREQAIEKLQGDQSLSLAEVGRQLDVSREYIRQIADDIPGASRHRSRYCNACGERVLEKQGAHAYRMGFCPKCWTIEKKRRWQERWSKYRTMFTCEMCGREFFRENSEVRASQKSNRSSIRFCSRSCRGKMLSRRYGFGSGWKK